MDVLIETDADNVFSRLEAILDLFGLDAGVGGEPLGDQIAHTFARNAHERAEAGRGSEGDWERNRPSTIRKKGFDKPNIESGQMMSEASLAGDVVNTPEQTTITYGTGAASGGRSPTSDAEKAHWAHVTGGAVARPFYALTEDDKAEIQEITAEELAEYLKAGF